ncbi:glutamine--scyllo-inositol aminotransferase [Nocardiopsis sp. TSRI0078]|uniref:DegT/DnrJ/EryC1/StrS family aminotransferase n=1 Tax=unclassified Nocardiopsis TaxID=2649073 RepID=UPI00093A2FD5|nr:DegT/DnrJ/EryC1/StrS family aminotransferase [Nocardiopsis sp. TSRI0078]OKI23468.1 glutamine--scyllo-inositol aminotransferase [Nocardiopsis sp. TSRI0078]
MINVFQPSLGREELTALEDVFADSWPGLGPRTTAFEEAFASHLGVDPRTVVFVNSATSGLFLAVELLGLGPGDDVVLPSVSFVGAANAVCAAGARPVFCDVDPRTLNPSADDVERALTDRTRAVVLLHYGGLPGDVEAVSRLCRERGVQLVEDAACAVASRVGDRACGTFGDVAVWSFDSMKLLTTGDGGMVLFRDPEEADRARRLAYHGLRHASGMSASRSVSRRWWDLDVEGFGRRIVGNDLTAAIGLVQLGRLPEFVERRRRVADAYDRLLAGAEGVEAPPPVPEGHTSSHYFHWVRLDPEDRDRVAAELLERGVYTTFRYAPLHRVPAYGSEGLRLPGAEEAAERTLLLPQHQGLSDADVERVAKELTAAVGRRSPERRGRR